MVRPTDGSGLDVAAAFHRELVGPLLGRELPGLRYAAARLGSGSDVLGLDDATSRDHDWGCRLTVLVDEADRAATPIVDELLTRLLPETFRGLPVRFPTTWDPTPSHKVDIAVVGDFATSRLGVDPLAGLSTLDWLILTGQSVLEVTAGRVYADATTELRALRHRLTWYPPEVERFLLACGWKRLSQRLPMVGRTAHAGQPRQSRLLSAALVQDLTSQTFLLHQRWSPYDKWREAAFARLPCAGDLGPRLDAALTASGWEDREDALVAAVEVLLAVQHSRGLPTPTPAVVPFWDRPYRTVAEAVPRSLLATVTDPALSRLPVLAGSVEQWVDSVDVLTRADHRATLTVAYRAWLDCAEAAGPGGGGAFSGATSGLM